MSAGNDPARERAARGGFAYYLPNGSAKVRVECPNANCPSHYASGTGAMGRSATPYCSVETGEPVQAQVFGRCRHVRKCGYDVRPTMEDVRNHDSGAGVMPDAPKWTPPPPRRQKKFGELLPGSMSGSAFDNHGAERFGRQWERVLFRYHVRSEAGVNVFPYADELRRVRIVKKTVYRIDAGRLTKKDSSGKARTWTETIDESATEWCLFGAHLVTPGSRVAVVESEDAALFMAAAFPDDGRIWCAASGDQIRKHRAWMQEQLGVEFELFPDLNRINAWREDVDYLRAHGIACAINPWWEAPAVAAVLPEMGEGDDPRDWLDIMHRNT